VVRAGTIPLIVFLIAVTTTCAWPDSIRTGEFWISAYQIDKAWQYSRGAGVVAGVIDLRIDVGHPDLAGQVSASVTLPGADQRDTGHGTAVAGILAGHGHGTTKADGMMGVAPGARLVSAVNAGGDIGAGMRWAVDRGARVVGVSQIEGPGPCATDSAGVKQRADVAYAESHDVVIVAGAGNNDGLPNSVGCPAAFPGLLR
jgi:subtilisin family serine protease